MERYFIQTSPSPDAGEKNREKLGKKTRGQSTRKRGDRAATSGKGMKISVSTLVFPKQEEKRVELRSVTGTGFGGGDRGWPGALRGE